MDMRLYDAQSALTFLVSQTTTIEPTVYRTQYPDIQYPQLIPVDTSANEWTSSITFFSTDMVGQAAWFHAGAQDVPNADVVRSKFEQSIEMAAIGYQYNVEEINKARLVPGGSLTADRAMAARRAYQEFVENIAFNGDTQKGWQGLINNSGVTAGDVAADGTSSSPYWVNKTPDLILRDVNALLAGVFTSSNTVEIADTLLLPWNQYLDIGVRRLDVNNAIPVMEYLRQNNIYTMQTGRPLTIRGVRGLDDAGSSSSARMIAYRKDPSVIKMHLPMPHRFLDIFQKGPLLYEVPGIFRLGGVEIRRPGAVRYGDKIAA